MKSHYIQIKDDIYIRLDFFDTNIILIVKGFGVNPIFDEILFSFPPLKSYKLSAEGRTLFKDVLIKELSGISPKEIENAIFEMEEEIEKIDTIKLVAKTKYQK